MRILTMKTCTFIQFFFDRMALLKIFILTLFSACTPIPEEVEIALELAGDNRAELQAVIDHYQTPEDSLKLEAAYFLIGNMPEKITQKYPQYFDRILKQMDSLNRIEKNISLNELDSLWEQAEKKYPNFSQSIDMDLNMVTADMLIENIDMAVEIWRKVPWSSRFDFDEFCELILPYRNIYDRPSFWRKDFYDKYSRVIESFSQDDIITITRLLNDSIGWFKYSDKMRSISNVDLNDLSVLQYGTCNQHSSLKIGILRSLGIPAAQVFGYPGTAWVVVYDENKIPVDYGSHYTPKIGQYYRNKRFNWFPKIFMNTFRNQPIRFPDVPQNTLPEFFQSRNRIDVSKFHTLTADVEIELDLAPPSPSKLAYLCVYYWDHWVAVDVSLIQNSKVSFEQMGINNIYLPAYYNNGKYYSASDPFYLDGEGKSTKLVPDFSRPDTVKLFRKGAISIPARKYSDLMKGAVFEGSNDPVFKKSVTLAKIEKSPNIIEKVIINRTEKFRYVRYRSDTLIGISEITFFDHNQDTLTGKVIFNENFSYDQAINTFDGDTKSNCNNDNLLVWQAHNNAFNANLLNEYNSNQSSWVGLDLGVPSIIKEIHYNFRNSWQMIDPGTDYELFYWDKKWISLGIQKADLDFVSYLIPSNAVFKLVNETHNWSGQNFIMTDGKQVFSGSMN